jgi:hypothetical protein
VAKGLIDKVRILADEPADLNLFQERLFFLKKCAPLFKFKVAIDHGEFMQRFTREITDFVPDFITLCQDFEAIKAAQSQITGKLYWYVCCGPDIPNTFIRSHLLESCAIILLTEYMGLDGFLRWDYTAWPERPRERISYRAQVWPAGDMCFVYPAASGKPLLSLRYMALLKGIQMFELIQMLKDSHGEANIILDRVFRLLFKFREIREFDHRQKQKAGDLMTLDYNDYNNAIEMILDGICSDEGQCLSQHMIGGLP